MTLYAINASPRKSYRQFSVVDRSAHAPMKNAASCEKQCELQNTLIIGTLNAHCGLGLRDPNHVRTRVVNLRINRVFVRGIASVIRTRNLVAPHEGQSAYTRCEALKEFRDNGAFPRRTSSVPCAPRRRAAAGGSRLGGTSG